MVALGQPFQVPYANHFKSPPPRIRAVFLNLTAADEPKIDCRRERNRPSQPSKLASFVSGTPISIVRARELETPVAHDLRARLDACLVARFITRVVGSTSRPTRYATG